jgi:dTDP-4-dehydrorhamnose 3,5-epimerase-like enzyme
MKYLKLDNNSCICDHSILWLRPELLRGQQPGNSTDSMNIKDCKLIDLPKIADPRGNLTFIECYNHIPFAIKRVFYLYDVPGGSDRGGHALKSCHQFLIAMSGSFDVILYDGKEKQRIHLNRSYYGLHIPPMIWREMDNFSSGSVCLSLASELYDPNDYYRDYNEYLRALAEMNK